MHIKDFKSIVSAFSDPGSEILFEKSKVIFSVNGDILDVSITTHEGDVLVDDSTGAIPASNWILKRLARLPLLATRLKETVGDTKTFVSPAAQLLPSLDVRPEEDIIKTDDALKTTLEALNEKSPFETSVLYITSDAGEGKTFLINQMAREQAQRFTDGSSDWLLVPIPLGGKTFLRFDDIIVGALQNRYRFPFLYYDSFLALVRMGVIIPAFDGFEEMFIETSSGEALSAMGILLAALDSRGSMVIAARKAYFDFEGLKTQEKLFDTISSHEVGFGKLELTRWGKQQFLAYCMKRNVNNAELIYERVSERLGAVHSLLTRPVLVRRLVDIATETESLDSFIDQIHASGPDFFATFVRGIIVREATEKWIERDPKDVGSPLLSVDEHFELLSDLAIATWESRVDFLKRDILEFLTDYFSETKRKSSTQAQQIRDRIHGHALLTLSQNARQAVEFDHEEFRLFFLGEGIASQMRPLNDKAKAEILAILRRGGLPKPAQKSFIQAIKRHPEFSQLNAAKFLLGISALDGQASYTQENCSWLIIRLLSGIDAQGLQINNLAFSTDSLRDRKLTNINFATCFFAPSSMDLTAVKSCQFLGCHFGQLSIYESTKFDGVEFRSCTVDAIRMMDRGIEIWEPSLILRQLENCGIGFPERERDEGSTSEVTIQTEHKLRDLEKLIRYFTRSTHIGESVILMKLGPRSGNFLAEQVPELLELGVLSEIENRGGDTQRRFKLGMTLEVINRAINAARGSYSAFIHECANQS